MELTGLSQGALTTQILSASDGPHEGAAALFVERGICEECWDATPVDDGLCASCIAALEEEGRALERMLPSTP